MGLIISLIEGVYNLVQRNVQVSQIIWNSPCKHDFTFKLYKWKLIFYFLVSFFGSLLLIKFFHSMHRLAFTSLVFLIFYILRNYPLRNWTIWTYIAFLALFVAQLYCISYWVYHIKYSKICDDGHTYDASAHACNPCPADYYAQSGDTICNACPVSSFSQEGSSFCFARGEEGSLGGSVRGGGDEEGSSGGRVGQSSHSGDRSTPPANQNLKFLMSLFKQLMVNEKAAEFLYVTHLIAMIYSIYSILMRLKNTYITVGSESIFSLFYYRNIFTACYLAYKYDEYQVSKNIPDTVGLDLGLGSKLEIAALVWVCLKLGASNIDSEKSTLVGFNLSNNNVFDYTKLQSFLVLLLNVFADSVNSSCVIVMNCLVCFLKATFVLYAFAEYSSLSDENLYGNVVVPLGLIIIAIFSSRNMVYFLKNNKVVILVAFVVFYGFSWYTEVDVFGLRVPVQDSEPKFHALAFAIENMRRARAFYMTLFPFVDENWWNNHKVYAFSVLKYFIHVFVFEFIFLVNLRFGMVLLLLPLDVFLISKKTALAKRSHTSPANDNTKAGCITQAYYCLIVDPVVVSTATPRAFVGSNRWQNIMRASQEKMYKHFEDCKAKVKSTPSNFLSLFSNDSNWFNLGSAWHEVYSGTILGPHCLDDIVMSHALLDLAKVLKYSRQRKKEIFRDFDAPQTRDLYPDSLMISLNHIIERGVFQLQYISMFIRYELLSNYRLPDGSEKVLYGQGGSKKSFDLKPFNAFGFLDINDQAANTTITNPQNRIIVCYMAFDLVSDLKQKDQGGLKTLSGLARNFIKNTILKLPWIQQSAGFLIKGFYGTLMDAVPDPFPAQKAENIVLAIESFVHLIISSRYGSDTAQSRSLSALDYLPIFLQSLIAMEIAIIEYLCHFCYFVEDFLSDAISIDPNAHLDPNVQQLRDEAIKQRNTTSNPNNWTVGLSYDTGVNPNFNPRMNNPIQPTRHFIAMNRYKVQDIYQNCQSLSQLTNDPSITNNAPLKSIAAAVDDALNKLLAYFGETMYKHIEMPTLYRLRLERRRSLLNVA